MNTSQLQCCVNCDPTLHGHVTVCAADRLPKRIEHYPHGFIVNTDTFSQTGTHWCAIFIRDDKYGEFFDSYGKGPGYYNSYFSIFLRENTTSFAFNEKRIQSNQSNVCGLYCLFYLHQRFKGLSLIKVNQMFSATNFELNDSFISRLISRLYSHCVKSECAYNQGCKALNSISF